MAGKTKFNAPKGTSDKLPKDIYKWHTIEKVAQEIAETYGFKEIRTPTFEDTNLFARGVGDTTDVVQKEMYTFRDNGDRSITLKPEGTAGAVRSAIETGMINDALPLKLYYFTRCFRYEKMQLGRFREFNQFGVEVFGAREPICDAETISLANDLINSLGLRNITLEINSIGCPECRKNYQKALLEYYAQYKEQLCETCLTRLERNPMRLLDCKSPICHGFAENAPEILDYLCEECSEHFDGVKECLDTMGIKYEINSRIVRGLDYYTNTVFEFIANDEGFKGAVCAGGRYDGLVEELGGPKTCGLGFAAGMERLIMIMEAQGLEFKPAKECDIYIASMGKKAAVKALMLAKQLRDYGFWAECDIVGRGMKAQMKYADKIGAKFSIVIGDNEIETGTAQLKNWKTSEKTDVSINGNFAESVNTLLLGI